MRQKLFRRLGALLIAFLMLLPVMAVPIVAEDAETGQQANGFAVYQFENLKTIGENLSGQLRYLGDSGVAAMPYRCSIDLQPDTWYDIGYTVDNPAHEPFYMLYCDNKVILSPDSVTFSEFILYTGKKPGAYRLEIYSRTPLEDCISQHRIYRVSSFDTVYDVRYTSFAQDHNNLFPEIDLSKYNGATGDFIELLTVYENITIAEDYTWDGQVYLYLFNPSGKMISGGTLTCPDDDGKSTPFSLVPVVTLEDVSAEDWRFVKLEVTGHWWHQYEKNDDGSVNIHTRRRQITDLTLKFEDGSSKTFPYNGSFVIQDKQTGDKVTAKSVKGNFESKINLEINYTYYRTDTSPKGAYYHNQVDSIYFNVPKYLEESYGKLTDVKLSYQRVRTSPMFVTDNAGIYNALKGNLMKDATTYNSSIPELWWVQMMGGGTTTLGLSYNIDLSKSNVKSNRVISPMRSVFYAKNVNAGVRAADSSVSRDELNAWMYQYAKLYSDINYLQGAKGQIPSHFFSSYDDVTTVNVATLGLKAESFATNHSFFDKLLNYGLSYAINGSPSDYDLDLSQAIVKIEAAHQIVGKSDVLYFAESDESNLRNCLAKADANDQSMYLVRFNVSQYYQRTLAARFNGKSYNDGDESVAYVAEQDIYLNLHVLELTYKNESGVETTVPVTSNHIDCIADLTAEKPPERVNDDAKDDLLGKIKDQFARFGKILAMILGIVAVVLIAVFVVPVAAPIFKAIFDTISNFFRWIGETFRGASAKRKQRRSGRK